MRHESPREYAERWVDAWNRRDVEAVLALFADDVRFTSPTAAALAGTASVSGKDALRAYWQAAVQRSGEWRFVLDRAIASHDSRELTIAYNRIGGRQRIRACEILRFNNAGLVVEGEALYGAVFAEPTEEANASPA